jgi:hypothetical protein
MLAHSHAKDFALVVLGLFVDYDKEKMLGRQPTGRPQRPAVNIVSYIQRDGLKLDRVVCWRAPRPGRARHR